MQSSRWAHDHYLAGFYHSLKLPLELLSSERNNSSRCYCCHCALEERVRPLRKREARLSV